MKKRDELGKFSHVDHDIAWLESKTQPIPECGCWVWEGFQAKHGYGTHRQGDKNHLAHRFAFEIANGYMPKEVMHSCDNRLCCNPAHLSEGTHSQNMRGMIDRGRGKNQFRKKVPVAVRNIIKRSNERQATLAKMFGITQSAVSRIKTGKDNNRTR